jgi:hypothetical protein
MSNNTKVDRGAIVAIVIVIVAVLVLITAASLFLGGVFDGTEGGSLGDWFGGLMDSVEGFLEVPPPPVAAPTRPSGGSPLRPGAQIPPEPPQTLPVPAEYQPYHVLTLGLGHRIPRALLHGDWMYFAHGELNPEGGIIFVERMSRDGGLVESVLEVPWVAAGAFLADFDLTLAGTIRMLLLFWYEDEPMRLVDAEFDRDGSLIVQRDLSDIVFFEEELSFTDLRVFFSEDGGMVIYGHKVNCGVLLSVIAPDGSLDSAQEVDCGQFARMSGGEVILLRSREMLVLDFPTGTWQERTFENHLPRFRTHLTPSDSAFSFYLALYQDSVVGLDLDTEELTRLIDWREKEFYSTDLDHLLFRSGEEIVMLRFCPERLDTFVLVFPYEPGPRVPAAGL